MAVDHRDAKDAGSAYSENCTLILTEDKFMTSFALSGISSLAEDEHKYGVLCLDGKLLNVRQASPQKLQQNLKIQKIKDILGLQDGKSYESVNELRYGHVLIMADQDPDGSHVKGLLINMLHYFCPSLLEVSNFVQEFIVPIVKASNNKTKEVLLFYTIPEYEAWEKEVGNKLTEYIIMHYKGLANIPRAESKYYFAHLDQHIKDFVWVSDEDGDAIKFAFSKQKIEAINDWLRAPQAGTYFDPKEKQIRYLDFINKEFKQYAVADLQRSIPSMVDGLTRGQRKILFCAFKNSIIQEIGVDQLSHSVLGCSAYHQDEATLVSTIIGMAHDFVGSNNINLLQPNGLFGTRVMGGKDHGGSGYICTRLSPITRHLFHKDDELLLNNLNDGGQSIEPEWFIPIIPMILVNGSKGRGTHCSSFIPNYNPKDIIANLKRLLKREAMVPMIPWYKGFKGDILKTSSKEYTAKGNITEDGKNTLSITELPVGTWTEPYMDFLEAASRDQKVFKAYTARVNTFTVHFKITMTEDQINSAKQEGGLWNRFNLTTTLSTTNMHLLSAKGELKKYDTPEQILEEFYHLRLYFYKKRRIALLREIKKALLLLENKVKFINEVIQGNIVLFKKDLICALHVKGFKSLLSIEKEADDVGRGEIQEDKEVAAGSETVPGTGGYDYLLSIPFVSISFEKMEELKQERLAKDKEFYELTDTDASSLWLRDLDALGRQLDDEKYYLQEEYYLQEVANINFQSSPDDDESSSEIAEAPKKPPAKGVRDAAMPRPDRANKKT